MSFYHEAMTLSQPIVDVDSNALLLPASLADKDVDFLDVNGTRMPLFPSPDTVIETWRQSQRPVVIYEDLKLVVKVDASRFDKDMSSDVEVDMNRVRFDEAAAMHFVRQSLPHDMVPLPQVYGWRRRGSYSLIYMSLAPGKTLMDCFDSLTTSEKEAICAKLGLIVQSLRSISPPLHHTFIGSAVEGPVRDAFTARAAQPNSFDSVAKFHDFLSAVAIPACIRDLHGDFTDYYRQFLPDSSKVFFTHADLTLTNIMIDGSPGSRQISSIIDWEQAGWYPEYWEYCKIHIAVNDQHAWRAESWADRIMPVYEEELYGLSEYWQARPP